MKRKLYCPTCSKDLVLLKSEPIGSETIFHYKCGHSFAENFTPGKPLVLTGTQNGFKARAYQVEGIDFIVNGHPENPGGFNCIIGDKMRLGKTPQALLALASAKGERFPCLLIVKSTNAWQWIHEITDWTQEKNSLALGTWIIEDSIGIIPPGFQTYVISRDLLASEGTCKACGGSARFHKEDSNTLRRPYKKLGCSDFVPSGNAMVEKLLTFGFKLCIVDEAHGFKNPSSSRARAFQRFIHEISREEETHEFQFKCSICKKGEWTERVLIEHGTHSTRVSKSSRCPECFAQNFMSAQLETIQKPRKCGLIHLTGTAIKNSADEFWVLLNSIAPARFPSRNSFKDRWLESAGGSKLRVKPWLLESFHQEIKPYYLRREWEDVYGELPPLNRIATRIVIEDESLKKLYNQTLDTIEEKMTRPNLTFFDSIGELSRLRQITAIAKVPFAKNYAESLLEDSPQDRLVIGVHHHSVRDLLKEGLSEYGVLSLDGTTSPAEKYRIMRGFKDSPERIALIGEVAGAEGLDMYYVEKALVTERQWSSADEGQFEARFYNPDQEMVHFRLTGCNGTFSGGKCLKCGLPPKVTTIEYVIADGTIDEFFHNMVENKRKIFGETVSENWSLDNDPTGFMELMESVVSGRL